MPTAAGHISKHHFWSHAMRSTPRIFSFSLFFSIVLPGLAFAQSKSLSEVVKGLRNIHLEEKDDTVDVPEIARQLLPQMKHGLLIEITDAVEDDQNTGSSPEALREIILKNLSANNVALESPDETHREDDYSGLYGRFERLDVVKPPGHADLLAVRTTISIPYGDDSSLYIFRRTKAHWRLVLSREQNEYASISDAPGRYEFGISPPDENGDWFVVAVDVNAWPTSNWQAIRYEVMRPSSTPGRPKILFSDERDIYLGVDEPFTLSVRKNGFELRQIASYSIDVDLLTRVHVENYAVSGNRVTRITPYALRPGDFLDEWIDLPWEEAKLLTRTNDLSTIQKWHAVFQRAGKRKFDTALEFSQPCPQLDGLKRWQVGLSLNAFQKSNWPAGVPNELFSTISKRGNTFLLESLNTARPPGCPGEKSPEQATLHD
jgi:hypothetical protein